MKTPRTSPTDTIHADWWPLGEDCLIKTYLSGWDRYTLRAQIRAMRVEAEARPGGLDLQLLNYETVLFIMERAVVSTTLTFADGSPVHPITEDFQRLDEPDVEFIGAQINERLALWQGEPPPATQEEADEATFSGRPPHDEGDSGEALTRGNAPRINGGSAPVAVSEQLADAPVDLPQPTGGVHRQDALPAGDGARRATRAVGGGLSGVDQMPTTRPVERRACSVSGIRTPRPRASTRA